MLQAPMFDSLFFDPFSLFYDSGCPAEVSMGRRNVAEAFVISLVIMMFDERLDLEAQIAG